MGTPFRKLTKESRDALDQRIAYLYSEIGLTRKLIAIRLGVSASSVNDSLSRSGARNTTRRYHESELGLV